MDDLLQTQIRILRAAVEHADVVLADLDRKRANLQASRDNAARLLAEREDGLLAAADESVIAN